MQFPLPLCSYNIVLRDIPLQIVSRSLKRLDKLLERVQNSSQGFYSEDLMRLTIYQQVSLQSLLKGFFYEQKIPLIKIHLIQGQYFTAHPQSIDLAIEPELVIDCLKRPHRNLFDADY